MCMSTLENVCAVIFVQRHVCVVDVIKNMLCLYSLEQNNYELVSDYKNLFNMFDYPLTEFVVIHVM